MAEITRYLKHRRDTAANWTANNPTLLAGQLGIETDGLTTTPKFKIGDGTSTWTALPYFYGGSASAQDLNNVLTVGNTTSGQDIVLTTDDLLKFGNTTAAIYNDSNIIDPNHVAIATNTTFTGHTHILLSDGANEWHDESASAFISIMAGAVPNNSVQIDAGNDKINIFSGANGLNLQNDTYLNSLTASRLLSLDANKKIGVETGSGFLKLTSGVISYDSNTYLTTSAAALAYQPLDSDLTSWASVTRASGFDTFTATPSSSNLSSLLTDKTGTGVNVFGTSPTFSTDITTPLIIGGSAVGSTIQYKGTSGNGTSTVAAHQFLVGNNGATTAARVFNSGQVSIGNYASPTNLRLVTIGQDTAYASLGSLVGTTGSFACYVNQATPSATNHIFQSNGSNLTLNAPAGLISFATGGTGRVTFATNTVSFDNAGTATGAVTPFTVNIAAHSGQSSGVEISNFKVNGASKTWAAGAITTQRWNYFTANTAAFASASTITNSYGLYVEAATAGTNATITNNWALGTNGNIWIDSSSASIYLGNITPSSSNYALSYTAANELSVNAISTMRLRVGGTIYGTLTATSLSLGNYLTLGNVGSDIKLYMQRTGGKNTRLETTTASTRLYNESDTLMMWTAYNNGSFAPGLTSALATNATDGFLYVPSCAGAPTGVPTAITGKIPIVADSTNNKLYIYSGGAWVALN